MVQTTMVDPVSTGPGGLNRLHIDGDQSSVNLAIEGKGWTQLPREPFLEAVEAALGVIVVDDVPEVTVGVGGRWEAGGSWADRDGDPREYELIAVAYLTLARHLRAHPPADEAEITRIVAALAKTGGPGRVSLDAMARDLHAQGVRVTEAAQ